MVSNLLIDIVLVGLVVGGQILFLYGLLGSIFVKLCVLYVQKYKISPPAIDQYCETANIPFQIPFVLADYLKKKRKRNSQVKFQTFLAISGLLATFGLANVVLLVSGLRNDDVGLVVLGTLGLAIVFVGIFLTNSIAQKIIPRI
jgi:hypothetical protein